MRCEAKDSSEVKGQGSGERASQRLMRGVRVSAFALRACQGRRKPAC